MLEILGFIFWLSLFYMIILKAKFFKDEILDTQKKIILFTIKMLASCLYAYIVWHYYDGGDAMGYFVQGKYFYNMYHEISPKAFWDLMLEPNVGLYPDYRLDGIYKNSIYWTNNGSCFMARFNALLFFVSGGSYYTHSIIYGFVSFTGLFYLYKFCKNIAVDKALYFAIILFLVPSIVFWGAGIHKEAFTHLCLGMIMYYGDRYMNHRNIKDLSIVLLAMLVMYYIRNYVIFLLIPAGISYYITQFKNRSVAMTYTLVYLLILALAWIVNSMLSETGLIYRIVRMQSEFISGGGQSVINEKPMVPTLYGFLQFAPRAFVNAFFRPFFTDCYKVLIWISSIEMYFIYLLLIFSWVKFQKKCSTQQWNVALFFIVFGFTYCMLLGYLVNTFGAMVRYKSSALPFLLCGIVFMLDLSKLPDILKHYKKK